MSRCVKTVLDGPPGTGAREQQEIHCVVPTEEGLSCFDVTVENGAGRATHEWEFTKTPIIMAIKPAKPQSVYRHGTNLWKT